MKKYLITLFAATALVLTGCAGPSPVTPGETNTVAEDTTKDLTGDWGYSSDTFSFEAEVDNGEITIYILLDEGTSKGLYWTGTFLDKAEDGETIVSQADVDALASSLYGSGDEEKKFEFRDGKLGYQFTIMGVTTDVQLEKK